MNNKIKNYFSKVHNSLFITSQLFFLGIFFLVNHFVMAGKTEVAFEQFSLTSAILSFFLFIYLYNKKCDLRRGITIIDIKYLVFGLIGFLLFVIPVGIFISRKP